MSTPYTPGQPTGGPGYAPPVVEPATQNYAADYSTQQHSGNLGTPTTADGRPDV